MPISPLAFLNATPEAVFSTFQIERLDRHPGTPTRHRRRIPVPHWIYVTRESLDKFESSHNGKSEAGRKGGAPQALDWSAIDTAIRGEVKKHGLPNPKNPPGWWYQADVERFAVELIESLGDSASESTIRDHVRETLKNIEAGN